MRAGEKFRSDLGDWERRTRDLPEPRRLEALRGILFRQSGAVPEDTLAGIFTHFLSLYGSKGPRSGAGALEWLAGVVSLLNQEYDDTPFTTEEWADIRDLVAGDSGEMDMEALSYVLALVVENGAI